MLTSFPFPSLFTRKVVKGVILFRFCYVWLLGKFLDFFTCYYSGLVESTRSWISILFFSLSNFFIKFLYLQRNQNYVVF